MSYGLYNGSSEGFEMLSDGYIDYAKEVIAKRSIPDLRDGLKPVGRRILYAIKTTIKGDNLSKCATLVGRVMELHPHGDSSVYGALCGMTDINGSLNVPLFIGQGEFGRVFSQDTPAAMRYTKAKLSPDAGDYFRDMEACELIQSEEGEGVEPVVLPVRYPSVLINGTTGMAVGVATEIPSFNFHDVVNLTINYLKDNSILDKGMGNVTTDDLIIPDFPTGGVLVRNDSELVKIMLTGRGKLNIRAKVDINGKEIIVKEVPYGRTVEGIIKAINGAEIQGVSDVIDTVGLQSDSLLKVICKSKKVVEEVLLELYRKRILQSTVNSNMLVIEDGVPNVIGVYDIIKRWVAWRRKICGVKLTKNLEGIQDELQTLDYFIRLISNDEWRDNYVDKAIHKNKKESSEYLHSIFDEMDGKPIPDDVCNWIHERSVSAFNNGGRYAKRFDELSTTSNHLKKFLEDIDQYIIDDLENLLKEKSGRFARKTQVTYKDYRFSVIKSDEIEDTSYCVYALKKDGFFCKMRDDASYNTDDYLCVIPGKANSVLIGFDNYGRLLRVIGSEIAFTGANGIYLPKYFGVDAGSAENYRILYLGLLDGTKRMLLYKDGYIGFLDTSDFVDKKRIKVVNEGVDPHVFDRLLEVVEEKDFPKYVMFADDHNGKKKFGLVELSTVKEGSRKTRRKVLTGNSGMQAAYYAMFNDPVELYKFNSSVARYFNRLRPFKENPETTDMSMFKDGRYYIEGYLLEDTEE